MKKIVFAALLGLNFVGLHAIITSSRVIPRTSGTPAIGTTVTQGVPAVQGAPIPATPISSTTGTNAITVHPEW